MALIDEFSVPNLDAVNDEMELAILAEALGWLKSYTEQRRMSMRARRNGRVEQALHLEKRAERTHESLPASWKW